MVVPNSSSLRQLLKVLQHDVKNPIGNVMGYVELLRDGNEFSAEQLDLLKRIEHNCALVLEVLDRFSDTVADLNEPE